MTPDVEALIKKWLPVGAEARRAVQRRSSFLPARQRRHIKAK
jgi:hypothetical protein